MSLTDTAIRNVKPLKKPARLFDTQGLYLEVSPAGGKLWRLKYRFNGKEKRIGLGIYPAVPLAKARKDRDAARELLALGIDPSENRKREKAAKRAQSADGFESVAREWFGKHQEQWAHSHADKIIRRLQNDVFPWLGKRPISQIAASEILKVLQRIEARGALDTAHRAHQNIGQVLRYAVATGRADRDPSRDLRGALPPATHEHFPAFTSPADVGQFLRAVDAFRGTFVVQCALRIAPMLFVRPGELRRAMWEQIDLDKADWKYTITKTGTEHLVPLPKQAVAILKDLRQKTGGGMYVFSGRDAKKPMSDAAVNAALRRMGYDTRAEITGHGFRAMARTILHEELSFSPELIEHQLAHRVPDSLGRAYNRTKFIKQRREMMQRWADHLDELKHGAEIVPLHVQAA